MNRLNSMLCAGIPVQIDFDVANVWNTTKGEQITKNGSHAAVITAVNPSAGSELFYVLRNSWGSNSWLGLDSSKLCQVEKASVLLTKKDKANLRALRLFDQDQDILEDGDPDDPKVREPKDFLQKLP